MHWIAWRMLVGHRTKYLAMLFGVTFAALLIAQQTGLLALTREEFAGRTIDHYLKRKVLDRARNHVSNSSYTRGRNCWGRSAPC